MQFICDLEKGNLEQVEIRIIIIEKFGLIISIFFIIIVDLKNINEVFFNSQVEFSGLYNSKQFFLGILKVIIILDESEMEKNLEVIEIGDSIRFLNLFDVVNFVSNILNFELNEEFYFIDFFEIKKNENFLKDYLKFLNIEEFMNEDEQEMEKILMVGSILLVGVGEEDKIEMLNLMLVIVKFLIIDCLELVLFFELVFQFSELFGFVGIDLGKGKVNYLYVCFCVNRIQIEGFILIKKLFYMLIKM